jgi:hypothetical protein
MPSRVFGLLDHRVGRSAANDVLVDADMIGPAHKAGERRSKLVVEFRRDGDAFEAVALRAFADEVEIAVDSELVRKSADALVYLPEEQLATNVIVSARLKRGSAFGFGHVCSTPLDRGSS